MVLETKIWTLDVLVATRVLLLLVPLRRQIKERYVYSNRHYTQVYKYFQM